MLKKLLKKVLSDNTIQRLKKLKLYWLTKKMQKKATYINNSINNQYSFGINLIGDIKAETGLGQSMRILASIINESKIPFCIIQVDAPGGLEHNVDDWNEKIVKEPIYQINLIHINPSIWVEAYNILDHSVLDKRYNIAYWLWEMEIFPIEWMPCIETVNEIWAPSEFISNSIRAITYKKVTTIPYAIQLNVQRDLIKRKLFGLPSDYFLYLVMFDFKSVSERKNPMAAIEAYKSAFRKEKENVGLVLKVSKNDKENEFKKLLASLKDYKNIYVITENLKRDEIEHLIGSVDVLISLHRSEGFGLPLAEAMYMGVPVVATNWSANTEFMDSNCACMVDYQMIPIDRQIGPYKPGNRWAEADTKQAADYIYKLYNNREFYDRISLNGKNNICTRLSYKQVIPILVDRINQICDRTS